jgi:hypothetical protein
MKEYKVSETDAVSEMLRFFLCFIEYQTMGKVQELSKP